MKPKTAKEVFSTTIPEAIAKNPHKAKEINAVFVFKIVGAGNWTVDLTAATPSCVEGDSDNAQCTFEIQNSDFEAVLDNPALGMQLYFQGKLRIVGDVLLATKLQKLFMVPIPSVNTAT